MKRPRKNLLAGSAILLALLVVFAASFVLAGWAMMLASRTLTSEEASVAQKRRISYHNARNLGMQWARNGLGGNAITNVTVTLTNDWGQFSAASVASNILNTSIVDSRVNHFSPMPSIFTLPVSTTLVGAGVTNSNTFFFRSRSPLFGGYPLVAQTNTLGFTTNFSRISVATNGNGMVLMYAQSGALSNAPASTVYNSSVARTVANALGSSFPATVSAYPFTPLVSAPTGTNATTGQLTAAPPRTFTINALRAAINTAYGTNALAVTDRGPFRILGSTAGFFNVIHFAGLSGTIRNFLLINTIPIPPSSLVYNVGSNTYTLTAPGNHIYTISITGAGALSFLRNSTGSTQTLETSETTNRYLIIRSAPLLNNSERNPSKGTYERNPLTDNTRVSLTDNGSGGTSRLVGFELTNADLLALHDKTAVSGDGNKHITFTQIPGRGQANTAGAIVEGALVYNRAAYGSPTGIFFVLMNGPLDPTAYRALDAVRPANQFRIRCLVNGLPAIQIRTGGSMSFRYPKRDDTGVFAMTLTPSSSPILSLRPTTDSVALISPLLIHVEQDEFPADSSLQWRKVLMVFNAESNLDVSASDSALTFSYFDAGDFDLAMDSSNNTRPFNLSIAGRSDVINTSTRFVGGGGSVWNMGLTLRDSPATFQLNANQTLRLIGGIRSNSRVEATPATSAVVLERNTNPGSLELFSDRMGWIETWQQ